MTTHTKARIVLYTAATLIALVMLTGCNAFKGACMDGINTVNFITNSEDEDMRLRD